MEEEALEILEEAKAFYSYTVTTGGRCNYYDYEQFKSRLLDAGCYGYERQLADILHI